MMELKKYKFGEICDIIAGGDAPKIVSVIKTKETPFPVYSNGITDEGLYGYTDKARVLKPAFTVSARGTIGVSFRRNEPYFPIVRLLSVIPKSNDVDLGYLFYYSKLLSFEKDGSVQQQLTVPMFANVDIFLPDIDTQQKTSSVLSNLDSKISLNRAINRNLEALAKQLYDYWFVQFDFPDENGKPYKSSGGKMVWNEVLKREVPEGWEVKSIGDVAEVYNGATPSTEDEQNYGGDIVWITPKDLSNQQEKFVYQGERNISQKGYDSCSTHLLPLNTILMSSRAPIGLLAIAKSKLCTNQGFKSFVPKNKSMSTYLYYYLQMHKKQVEQLGTGTTFKEVSRDDIMGFNIIVPENKILEKWEEILLPINNKQLELQKETLSLIRQRDELLPLLMNGQVEVGN